MPIINIPNVGQVNFPDTMSQADIVKAIENDILKKPGRAAEDVGFLEGTKAAIGRGIDSLTGESGMLAGLGLAKTALTGTEAQTKAKMDAIKADQQKPDAAPGMTVEDFQRIYKDKGLLTAAKEVPKYISEQIAQSAPQMAGPLAVGAATSPFLTPVGGVIAGMATYGVQQLGNFLVRQAQEKNDPKELELAKAALTAAGTAPLGYFADRFTVGLGGSTKKIGEEILQELSARQVAGEVGKGVAKGATRGIIAEAPTEVLEQAAERYQAGLSLTGPEAKNEYMNAFFGAAAAGGGIGGISGGIRNYAGTRTQPITEPDQSGISGAGMQGEASGGIRTADQTGLDFLGERPEEPLAGEAGINPPLAAGATAPTDFAQIDQARQQAKLDEETAALRAAESSQKVEQLKQIEAKLKQVNAYIRDLSEVDPQDDRIADAIDYAKRISEEGARLQEQVQAPQKVTALNAPAQDETGRPEVKPEFFKLGDAIVYEKGAFIKGDTKDDLMKASANFTEIVPSNSLYESFYENFPQFPKGSMDGAVFVHGINVNGKRGTGLGKQILDATTKWADQKGKAIFLVPAAQPDSALGGLTQKQLKEWYARNGFEDRVDYMVRPAQKVQALNAPEQQGFDFNAPEGAKQDDDAGIGPHEYRGNDPEKAATHYVRMMESGQKPAALVPEGDIQQKALVAAAEKNKWFYGFIDLPIFGPSLAVAKTPEDQRRLHKALMDIKNKGETQETATDLGRALGYSEKDIEAWHKYQSKWEKPLYPYNPKSTVAPIEEQEFSLLPPEGKVDTSTEIKPIEVPEYETSKFMFVTPNADPFKALNAFFNSVKPAAVSESEVKAHKAEIRKLQEAITEFQQDAVGRDRTGRLNTIRNFFDQFVIAPVDKQNEISKLPQLMPGMDAQTQQQVLAKISQLPDINTVRGMKDLNSRLDTAMVDYSEAKLGRSRESAILPWQAHEDVSTRKDAEALKKLSNIAEKAKTPEEKAATTYLTAHADYAFPFASAIRAAAFDLGAEQGPVFRAQNKENAQLFRNWAGNNLDPISLAKFDATVEEFRQMGDKIRKREFEAEEIAGGKKNLRQKFYQIHPSVETRIANNDLPGALRALSRLGTEFQKGLAKQLMKLDLKTTIGVGQQEDFAKYMVQRNAAPELEQVVNMLQESFPEVFQDHFRNLSDVRATYTALKDLKAGRLGVDRQTLEAYTGQLEDATEAYQAAVAVLDSRGTYMPSLDAININRDRGGNTTATFLHEVLHAATHWALDPVNYDSLNSSQKQAVDELKRMYNTTKGLLQFGNEVSSIDEFVVEAFTNPEFQRFLKDMPLVNTKQTLWDKFTQLISKIFGLNNMLGYTLANANDIFMAPPETSKEARALNLQGKLGGYILEDSYRASPKTRTLTDVMFNKRGDWDGVKDAMPSFLSGLKDSTRKHFLGALTLRQIEDIVGPRVPPFKEFINRMESMLDDRNATLNKTKDIVKPWMKWQSNNKKKGEILNALMLDATRMGIDPDINTSDEVLNRAWNDIGADGQKIYRQVRDFYANQLNSHIQVLLDRKATALKADGISENAVKSHPEYIALKQHFEKSAIQPYFPIRRFGQYWLQIGKGKTKEFYTFESARERNAFQKKRVRELNLQKSDKQVSAGNSIKEMVSENLADFEFLDKLKGLVARETGSTRKELKDNIIDSIEQMYLMTLPDQSIRKMFLNRQGIQGMNQDMLRAFTASAFRIAYQQSRFKHSDSLYGAVDSAESYIEGMDTEERKVYTDYIRELEGRLQYIMNPPDTGGIPSFLSNVSFIWYMTSPASALVNMLGVPAVGIPVVGARFGIGKTSAMMTSYARKFMGTGFKDPQGNWSFPSFTNKPGMFNERQQAAFDQFIADGLIDITLTHDIVGLAETNSNLYTGRTQKVMQVLSATFHGAEKFNREVVAMSSYDLAYERAKANGLSDDAAQKKAIDEAKELTYKSMFDYSTLNKPRYFQPAYAKVFLQFKQFSQQMTYMLARSAYEGFYKKFDANELQDIGNQINATRTTDGQPALEGPALNAAIKKYIKDFRAEGKKRLMGTLGATFLFAGATGLPGWSALSAMMEMLNTLFADEDEEDEPFDFDNWFKNWASETFGGFVGDSISRGVVTQASGVNLADRMGLDSMWFRDNRKSADEVSAVEATIVSLMGPAVGLAVSGGNALKQLNDGHLDRAIETATPAIIKNALKSARLGSEGALSLGGDVLVEDFSAAEIGAQALGFSPERLAQRQKANIEMKGAEQEIVKKHQNLLNAFFMAVDTDDDDMKDRVIDKISSFNRANPGSAITPKGLQASIKRRYQQRALAEQTGGTRINKKLIGQLGEMGNYGNPDE